MPDDLSAHTELREATEEKALATPFVRALVTQLRAHDTYGVWDSKPDAELLADFVVTKEQRKKIPIIAEPDPKASWRVELFFTAVAMVLENRTGIRVTPVIKVSCQGYGRALLLAGRLVALDRPLRDIHRFGFETIERLAETGTERIEEAARAVDRFPDAAAA